MRSLQHPLLGHTLCRSPPFLLSLSLSLSLGGVGSSVADSLWLMLFKQAELWMPLQGKRSKVSMPVWVHICVKMPVPCSLREALGKRLPQALKKDAHQRQLGLRGS